ncbi:Sulfide dehydrogenase [flavocytochrome c] flavoprotein chain precursor [Gimesia alba]|uniref:Sulfide dehydrogenase [flavocytochrome c] flavoprotein chain n=1 Tax=Gimesia alba TaxID=2527973 RepID=A0A517RGK1_9PLAN|nr:FAD/NAD(P)-binding oxidoreductase [Gimesia alba]QDT43002.1 Sulfide dehydrogenase [flavocytochrome c] flavoprotein chain precursor [Gimesia alba]
MISETINQSVQSSPVQETPDSILHHQVVIVGGGAAGITVAAKLTKGWFNETDVAIIDPADNHYYQPAWTLVGGGTYRKEATRRDEASVIPKKATWIQDAVVEFDPKHNLVKTRDGRTIQYDFLVVCAGIQINWDAITGLKDSIGKEGVCSNYSFETVGSTWENIRNFKGGTAIFTQPVTGIKCGGAPQKICYLADDYFRKSGVRDKTHVIFASGSNTIFAVERYRNVLEGVIKRKEIDTRFNHSLVAISADTKEAIFRNTETGEEVSIHYDMIHVTPPMGPPEFIAKSPLADEKGWVDVDKYTLQHVRYSNVFALGDSSNLPTSKTAAAIRKQSPVLVKNLQSLIAGKPLTAKYDGYTSCPLVTGYGKLVLAEFDYDKNPAETFPFSQAKERWSMWLVKKYVLPVLYWKGMLKGRA